MPWGRLDDESNSDPKLLALSNGAHRLVKCSWVYCAKAIVDGFVPEHAITTWGVRAKTPREFKGFVDELLRSLVEGKGPLWHKVPGGYQVHDWLDWNDPREKILAERARSADRVQRFRARLAAARASEGTRNALQPALPNGVAHAFGTAHDTRHDSRSEHRTTPTADQKHQEQRRDAGAIRVPRWREPEESPQVLTKIAHTAFDEADANVEKLWTDSDIEERINVIAAQAGIRYDGDRVPKAMESARVQRALVGKGV